VRPERPVPSRKVHLVCNAHIDPVWLWEWPEGAGEALSTFRTAAEFCERRPEFVFSHNEAILYQWIEEYEPALFRRIRALVRKKRWAILGGWFVQPDCNMPSGESFVRQILTGKRYFHRKFGVDVKTAANLDPFGHTRGLVQILAKSGYRSYLFCRPDKNFAELPADDFVWVGYDGSEVLACRAAAHYNSKGGGVQDKIEKWLKAHPKQNPALLLWGIGNHGGGASARDLDDIDAFRRVGTGDAEISHSTAAAYFEELEQDRKNLPRHAHGLNPWAVGCYTTMARVKQAHRRLENELFSAEKMASGAAFQDRMPYPGRELAEAQRDLAFAEFHDLLPGSSIAPGEEGALRLLHHGLEICSRVKARSFFALAAGEPKPRAGDIPIFVHNPHPFPIRADIECEFQGHEPNYGGGFLRPRIFSGRRELPAQAEKELSNLSLEWRKKIVFRAELRPGCMNRFICRTEDIGTRPVPELIEADGVFRFRTPALEADIDARTGRLARFRVHGRDILAPGAFRLLVMADNADPWGQSVIRFRKEAGRFRIATPKESARLAGVSAPALPPVRVIEDGEVRTIVEAVFVFGASAAVLRYKLPKQGLEIEVEVRILWNEKDRMLKLSVPTVFGEAGYFGQTAYGREALPTDGAEAVAQKWTAVVSPAAGLALTCINDGTYGSDFRDGEMRLSLLRSPAHAADPAAGRMPPFQDRFIPRIDQGEHVFRFWLTAGPAAERLDVIDREALARNEAPYALAYFPPGQGKKPRPFAALSDGAVQITVLKKAENSAGLVIRLFEPTGRRRTTTLSLPFAAAQTKIALGPFEIKTLVFNPQTRAFAAVDLLERPLGKD
jgi:alpha-mannosidase